MRLFVAILLPDVAREHLSKVQRDLAGHIAAGGSGGKHGGPKIGWTKPENLHATVKFLGEVPDTDMPGVCTALSVADLGLPFALHTAGLAHFPPHGRINVIAAELAGDLSERRPYTPHITLARPRDTITARQWAEQRFAEPPPQNGPTFRVEKIALMCSDLGGGAPVYRRVAHFELAGDKNLS
jgi:2'-5' RNA ligase